MWCFILASWLLNYRFLNEWVFLQHWCSSIERERERSTLHHMYCSLNYKTIFFSKHAHNAHWYMLEPFSCPQNAPTLLFDLDLIFFHVRGGIGALTAELVDYACLSCPKQFCKPNFKEIRLFYNTPHLKQKPKLAFLIFSTTPYPYAFSLSQPQW